LSLTREDVISKLTR